MNNVSKFLSENPKSLGNFRTEAPDVFIEINSEEERYRMRIGLKQQRRIQLPVVMNVEMRFMAFQTMFPEKSRQLSASQMRLYILNFLP